MIPNLGDIALIPVASMKHPTIGEETGKYRLGVATKLDDDGHVGWIGGEHEINPTSTTFSESYVHWV